MFSKLTVKLKLTTKQGHKYDIERAYNAFDILALMQQAWPMPSAGSGDGSKSKPWTPKTPSQWFYCAKVCGAVYRKVLGISTTESSMYTTANNKLDMEEQYDKDDQLLGTHYVAWLKVGGRYMRVTGGNLYSSDWGTDQSGVVYENSSYPFLWSKIGTKCNHLRDW